MKFHLILTKNFIFYPTDIFAMQGLSNMSTAEREGRASLENYLNLCPMCSLVFFSGTKNLFENYMATNLFVSFTLSFVTLDLFTHTELENF
jgi:hypothetical protein